MTTDNPNSSLILGIAAVALAIFAAGLRLYRRQMAVAGTVVSKDNLLIPASTENTDLGSTPEVLENSAPHEQLPANTAQEGKPLAFFLLLFAITIPYWIFGEKSLPIPVKLPVSAFAAFNPMIAALILTYWQSGIGGIKDLFKKAFDFKKINNRLWYIPIVILPLLVYALSYAVMRLAGRPLPELEIQIMLIPVFAAVFILFGIGEELGWMGYAVDPLQKRWGALKAAVVIGIVWGLFHLIPDLQNNQTADWIFWQRFGTILLRILIVWIYNNTGKSVFSSILFHAANNLGWALFPNFGTHYDPFVTGIILCFVTGIVIFGWDAKTLTRNRFVSARS